MTLPTATLPIACPDRCGLVATFANFIYKHIIGSKTVVFE